MSTRKTSAKKPNKRSPKTATAKKVAAGEPAAKGSRVGSHAAGGTWFPTNASSPANYALMSMHTTLSLATRTFRDEGARRIYSAAGHDVATLELDGDELVVEFESPRRLDVEIDGARTLSDFLHHYEPVAGNDGWLRFRCPATRDPRPALDARIGPMLGQAARQRESEPTRR